MLVGYNSERQVNLRKLDAETAADPFLGSLRRKQLNLARWELSEYQVLEDNHAPVDYLTAHLVAKASRKPEPGFAVSGEEMMALIRQQLAFGPRHLSAPGHARTQAFIQAELEALTDDVKLMSWTHKPQTGEPQKLVNVIGRFAPDKPVRVLLGTHYDSKRYADKDPDDINAPVPGANDAASGVAVLLDLARVIATNRAQLPVGVDLVFFDAEEGDENVRSDYKKWQPMGSITFAKNLGRIYVKNDKPRLGIVLDMVCDADLEILPERNSNQAAGKVVRHFWKHANKRFPEVFGTEIGKAIIDDHVPLIAAGIPSILLIDFEYPPFHTQEDTLDKCSADSLKKVGQTLVEYLYSLQAPKA
jgi:glutaminyl-peptide cyclotransferase